jgi:hypothetical protein
LLLKKQDYFLVVSALAVSVLAESVAAPILEAVSILAESILAESILAESVAEDEPEPLQAANEVAIAKANKPSLNEFFMFNF